MMSAISSLSSLFTLTLLCSLNGIGQTHAQSNSAQSTSDKKTKIVLVAGETALVDVVGHHDYKAGCACLDHLLHLTSTIETVLVSEGWPTDEAVFDGANSIVFYTDGGGKQAFLDKPSRSTKLQSLVDQGVGIVMIHQAVDFPDQAVEQAKGWLGGVYEKSKSGRGHWDSSHVDFPLHPITRGVTPWKINDGWLNAIQFVDERKGVTPLVWSGKEYSGSRAGLDRDIVAWAYDRPSGGRSFSFTGLDAHSAWSLPGMRQLVVNGVLWTAGVEIPERGAPIEIEEDLLVRMQTPRTQKPVKPKLK